MVSMGFRQWTPGVLVKEQITMVAPSINPFCPLHDRFVDLGNALHLPSPPHFCGRRLSSVAQRGSAQQSSNLNSGVVGLRNTMVSYFFLAKLWAVILACVAISLRRSFFTLLDLLPRYVGR
jgi:hypothetical protein